MSWRWRLLGTKKKRDQFQNPEGKSQHIKQFFGCSLQPKVQLEFYLRKRFLMGFPCVFVFLWLCLCMKKTISSLGSWVIRLVIPSCH